MSFNLTDLQAATNIGDIILAANQFTGGVLLAGFSIAIFFVFLMKNQGELGESIAVSSFISLIIATILGVLGVLNFAFALGYLVLTALATFYLYMRPQN